MKKAIHYFDECWMENFWIFLGWPPHKVEASCREQFDFDSLHLNGDGKTIEFQRDDGRHVIAIWTRNVPKKSKDIAVLAHECVHAAHICLNYRGLIADFKNDEPVAYLTGALMRQALR